MIDDTTPALAFPLPHPGNDLAEDVARLRAALLAIESQLLGRATLEDGRVPLSQLPASLDEVIEATSVSAMPTPGEAGKIYVTTGGTDPNRLFRWSGTGYTEVSANHPSTSELAEGEGGLYFTVARAQQAVSAMVSTVAASVADLASHALVLDIGYEQRGSLREVGGPVGKLALVKGLGLFRLAAGSSEPDDDESCFVCVSGVRWLLEAVH